MNTIIALLIGALGLVSGLVLSPRLSEPSSAQPDATSQILSDRVLDSEQPDATDYVSVRPYVSSVPASGLSAEERASLIFMREEEKLARDVYSVLYDRWQLPIFANIAQSEQTHTEAVRTLLEKYEVPDPVGDDAIGRFTDANLALLYTELVEKGSASLEAALETGALIEDLDLRDLAQQSAGIDNEDILFVYENLARGSRNHIRAFTRQLESRGLAYEPRYISVDEYREIIAAPQEKGTQGQGSGMRRGWGQ